MELHEHKSVLVLMDGRRRVAIARKSGAGLWLLKLYGASWADARIDPDRRNAIGYRQAPSVTDSYKVAKTKSTARNLLRSIQGI